MFTYIGARKPIPVTQRATPAGVYDAVYIPEHEGPCKVEVRYANQHVPGSPFKTNCTSSFDPTKVSLLKMKIYHVTMV